MRLYTATLIVAFLGASLNLFASDIEITNVVFSGTPADSTQQPFVYLTVSWKNSWRNKSNHDAAWIFFKLRTQNDTRSHRPCPVKLTGHAFIYNFEKTGSLPSFFVPAHQAGIVVYPSENERGNVSWRVKVAIDLRAVKGIDFRNVIFASAYAIELVSIPMGHFYVGDEDEVLQKNASAFYDGATKERFLIDSEKGFPIGTSVGSLNYENKDMPIYRGDVGGPVPETFPKGFQNFYIMKYELTSGQYAAFLNSLSNQSSAFRSNFGAKEYSIGQGAITLENNIYKCSAPERPANYISWDDGCAFADWAGLRPLTELEFEKSARGPNNVVNADYAWGSASFGKVSRYFNERRDIIHQSGFNESELNDGNREIFGASFYWVMDLCGSLWERVVTIGSEKGRAFTGTHGDGLLDQLGNATNEDWPTEAEGGFGYRGGGTYDFGMAFGPTHAQVASRNYGSWGDGPRSVAYGFRAGLTAR